MAKSRTTTISTLSETLTEAASTTSETLTAAVSADTSTSSLTSIVAASITTAVSTKSISSSAIQSAIARVGRSRKRSTPTTDNLLSGIGILSAAGTEMSITVSRGDSVKDISETFLFALGCSMDCGTSGYSLIEDQTDTETISNENIFDETQISRTTNNQTLALDKFSNSDDPFYELDDGLTQSQIAKTAETAQASKANTTRISMSLISSMATQTK